MRENIAAAEREARRADGSVTLVAVSKTFPADEVRPVIEAGQRVFGENRVQEAQGKWPALRAEFPDIELQLIGPLQSNKAREAVELFDVIETVDREKIASELAKEIARQGKAPRLFVQVNTGDEPQKAGIDPAEAVAFAERCRTRAWARDRGADVHPAGRREPGPPFRACSQSSPARPVSRSSPWACPATTRWRSPSAPPASGWAAPSSGRADRPALRPQSEIVFRRGIVVRQFFLWQNRSIRL